MFERLKQWFQHEFGCEDDEVIVKKGDTLWTIALVATGDGSRWHDLAEANPDRHWDDQHTGIKPGDKIKLPRSWIAS